MDLWGLARTISPIGASTPRAPCILYVPVVQRDHRMTFILLALRVAAARQT